MAVELSVLSGVGGWGWLSASNICLIGTAVVALWKMPATSASADEETTRRSVLHLTKIVLFRFGCLVILGCSDRWKYPAIRLRDFSATRYAASLSTCKTILLA